MPSMTDRARAVYRSMPSSSGFARSGSGTTKANENSTVASEASASSHGNVPCATGTSDATTSRAPESDGVPGRPESDGVTQLKKHSRHCSSVSDMDSDYEGGSDGGNETEVSEATAQEDADRDREMYRRVLSPSAKSPVSSSTSRRVICETNAPTAQPNPNDTTLDDMDDELRRLEDVPMVSLENFLRFNMRSDKDEGSGYESDATEMSTGTSELGDVLGEETTKDNSMYDKNTDLEFQEQVDPRVGAALDEMNQSATAINALERNLTLARRTRKNARRESERHLELVRLRVAKSVRNAVPYFHQQALASTHERNAQLSMAQYEKAHDAFVEARDIVDGKMEKWRLEEFGENDESTSETNLTPSKRADLSARRETKELTAYVKFSNTTNLTELEAMKLRAEHVYGKHIHGLTESKNQALRMKRKLTKTIEKARPYFEAKAIAEGVWDKLDESVREAQAAVRDGKARYQQSMDALAKISEEVHERRERESAEREADLLAEELAVEAEAREVVSSLVVFALNAGLSRAEAEEKAAREAAEAEAEAKEAAEEAARRLAAEREAAEKEAAENQAAETAAAREAAETAAREAADAAEKEAEEDAAREAAEKQAAREAATREVAEAAAREIAEREAAEAAAREAAEAAAEREAVEADAREAAEREAAFPTARYAAERQAADTGAGEAENEAALDASLTVRQPPEASSVYDTREIVRSLVAEAVDCVVSLSDTNTKTTRSFDESFTPENASTTGDRFDPDPFGFGLTGPSASDASDATPVSDPFALLPDCLPVEPRSDGTTTTQREPSVAPATGSLIDF